MLTKRTIQNKMAGRTFIWFANFTSVLAFIALLAVAVCASDDEDGALVAVDTVEEGHNVARGNVKYSEESFIDPNAKPFIPTKEWQKVEKGQSVPSGLHIRLNLQTGEREAKLLDGDDGKRFLNKQQKDILRNFGSEF